MQPLILVHTSIACYDGGLVLCIEVWIGAWNIDSLCGNGEVCDELREWMIDICCLREVR